MQTIHAVNVNDAFDEMLYLTKQRQYWHTIAPRGQQTMELLEPMATVYSRPTERVLFHPGRDANPFFHFFEALWILAGRSDVAFLKQFNSNIANYSDDGAFFHGAYGHRLRRFPDENPEHGYEPLDQISVAIKLLRAEHSTRQVVLSIWDPTQDLGAKTKDLPCNDLIFLKIRNGKLEMRVCCRSNDVIWGAYGANVVQFSTLQEFIAGAVGVGVGPYTQISDSYHIYTEREDWKKILAAPIAPLCPYHEVQPYPLFSESKLLDGVGHDYVTWLCALDTLLQFMENREISKTYYYSAVPYFNEVAWPMYRAWRCWKSEFGTRNSRIDNAVYILEKECLAEDWALAGKQWLQRRLQIDVKTGEVNV